MSFIIGQKIGMTRRYGNSHETVPITVVLASPNTVAAVKNATRDGYSAVQIGAGTKSRLNKPLAGQMKAANITPAVIKEFRLDGVEAYEVGQKIALSGFKAGDTVRVTAQSKGKGYAGVMKRHGFRGGPGSHGSDHHRAPGSIGSQQPQRIPVGKKMAGHMGAVNVTMTKVKVFDVLPGDNVILLQGAIPGPKKGWVTIIKNEAKN